MKSFRVPAGLASYKVKFRKSITLKDGTECEGMCDPEKKELTIENADPDVMFSAFWHEWTHAVFTELGMTEFAYNEAFVESLGSNIARAVRALPKEFK